LIDNQVVRTAFENEPCFLILGWSGESYFCPCSQCVPKRFSSCSHEIAQVPNLFPKAFPIAPQYGPIWGKKKKL